MTITKVNQSVKNTIRNKAAKKAKETGENVVVYEATVGKQKVQMITTVSMFEKCPNRNDVEFIAVIDENGNYVD
jgi:sensor histidine kinase regulating citrate/malate metabolism